MSLSLATSISAFCQKQPVPDKIRSIVVQDDKSAADCIEYLKKNRLGTATKPGARAVLEAAFLSQSCSVDNPIPASCANCLWGSWLW